MDSLAAEFGYFEWLCEIVHADRGGVFSNYRNLLRRLFLTVYETSNEYDMSRATDGKYLRYYYEENRNDYIDYAHNNMPEHNDNGLYDRSVNIPSNMLEMMIAFSKKINDQYLYDFRQDRTRVWFWMMVNSLGLMDYTNDIFRISMGEENNDVDLILYYFLTKAISSDGRLIAPLFQLSDPTSYYGNHSLWDQANRWIMENYDSLNAIDAYEWDKYFNWRNNDG